MERPQQKTVRCYANKIIELNLEYEWLFVQKSYFLCNHYFLSTLCAKPEKRKSLYSDKAPEILQYQKDLEKKNPYIYRLKRRLIQLREQQKLLALHYLKNEG